MDAVVFGTRTAGALLLALLLSGEGAAASGPAAWPPPMEPVLQAAWQKGLALERSESLVASTEQYELVARAMPSSATIRWRLSRNYWRMAERLPIDDKDGRLEWFTVSERWADDALKLDRKCGECVLWKIASMGRIVTTGGVVQAATKASDIAELIDYGIALRPDHVDNEQNATLANLYYAGSAFYRIVPDWFWLELVIGVRGDHERALGYILKAIAISGERLDYQVELGAVLLCMGHDDGDDLRIADGRRVLAKAVELENFQSTDSFDREHAHILIAHPARACGYSRDGWIDLSEVTQR